MRKPLSFGFSWRLDRSHAKLPVYCWCSVRAVRPMMTLDEGIQALCGTLSTQSQAHIKPVHRHLSHRLVIEGGFPPEWLHPRPPYEATYKTNFECRLDSAPGKPGATEFRILGGIKAKNLDVTVLHPQIGPVVGISAKSTGNAFRNLTNRMEEALGDCANIHMMYPGFVFGFLHFIKFASTSDIDRADATFDQSAGPLPHLLRYHDVLVSLAGRTNITDPAMRYESVGLIVYTCEDGRARIYPNYPPPSSPIHYSKFFELLYRPYDLRFSYPFPQGQAARKSWIGSQIQGESPFDAATGFPWSLRK
ncbi:MAG: hypothetical protein WD733_25100 [Bryobacterales bacterium]